MYQITNDGDDISAMVEAPLSCDATWAPRVCSFAPLQGGSIPLHIFQIGRHYGDGFSTAWRSMNPDFGYMFFDDDDMHRFLSATNETRHLWLWERLAAGVLKADLFRTLVLCRIGGVYADVDAKPHRPLRDVYRPDVPFIMDQYLFIEFMMFAPRQPLMRTIVDTQVANVHDELLRRTYHGRRCRGSHQCVIRTTGPIGVRKGIQQFLRARHCDHLAACTSGYLCPQNETRILRAWACGVSEHLDCRNSPQRRPCGERHYSRASLFFRYV